MNALSKIVAGSLASLGLLATLLSGAALAQVPDRVGRISYLSGDVQFYSESAQAWLPAQLNAPVSSRNSLYTGPDSRAEIRFGGTAVALDGQTQLDIQVLDDASFRAGVTRGSIDLRARQIERGETYEVTAPAASYAILQAGRYRVDAADNGSSVTVLAGLANASVAGDGSAMVESGQALSAADGGFVRSAARSSALDHWAAQRDDAYRSSQSSRYVSPYMTGYEELDANGRWASDPDYGNVWYPTTYVSAGWVPYRDGHWAYVPPWGWTWIDDAPWGFAPFHYGRWVFVGNRWGWLPGAYVARPSYAPALVGFIGGSTAGGVALSFSIGSQPAVGWYPLPPWESFRPAYTRSTTYIRNTNNFNISNPPSHAWRTVERNRVSVNQVQGATVVPREAFVDSRPVRRAALSVAAPILASPQVATAPVAAPTRLGILSPSGSARPEFGDRRGGQREPDQGRQPAAAPRIGNALPTQPVQPIRPESRPGLFGGENRGVERQAPPAIVAPQGSQPAPVPRVDNTSRPAFQPPGGRSPEPARGERGGERGAAPAAATESGRQARPLAVMPEAAPRRAEPPPVARPEPRVEQRVEPRPVPRIVEPRAEPRPEPRAMPRIVEPRAEPRPEPRPVPRIVEPRAEPRPEPRPVPRVEPRMEPRIERRTEPPPQARTPPPQAQPEQKHAPEQEHRPHGEKGKD